MGLRFFCMRVNNKEARNREAVSGLLFISSFSLFFPIPWPFPSSSAFCLRAKFAFSAPRSRMSSNLLGIDQLVIAVLYRLDGIYDHLCQVAFEIAVSFSFIFLFKFFNRSTFKNRVDRKEVRNPRLVLFIVFHDAIRIRYSTLDFLFNRLGSSSSVMNAFLFSNRICSSSSMGPEGTSHVHRLSGCALLEL